MAQVAQPISLLASVRAQLSPDSDTDSTPSLDALSQSGLSTTAQIDDQSIKSGRSLEYPHCYELRANEGTPNSHASKASEYIQNVNADINSHKNTGIGITMHRPLIENAFPNESTSQLNSSFLNDIEQFPDYTECNTPTYDLHEQAYKAAWVAAIQEDIRIREVDPFIEDYPPQPENKQHALEDTKNALADPELRSATRQRFIALTNMVIRLDFVLFRRSAVFLNPAETADAQLIANVLLGYVAWADGMVKELLDMTAPVHFVLSGLAREDVSEIVRHRRMACVVSAHLKKPRAPEQRLLLQFCNLYDQWVHDEFLTLRNHQIFVEEGPVMDRLELTRFLHGIWEILSRLIENYASYRDELNEIKDKFFTSPSGLSDGTIESFAEDLSFAE